MTNPYQTSPDYVPKPYKPTTAAEDNRLHRVIMRGAMAENTADMRKCITQVLSEKYAAELDDLAAHKPVKDATEKAYMERIRAFALWMREEAIPAFPMAALTAEPPVDEQIVALYLDGLLNNGADHKAVADICKALAWHAALNGFSSPCEADVVKAVVMRAKNGSA